MYNQPPQGYSSAPQGDASKDTMAYIALGLAVFSLCAWIIPLCGCPMSLSAIGLGYTALPSNQSTLAKVAIGIGVLTFILTIISAIIGAATSLSAN